MKRLFAALGITLTIIVGIVVVLLVDSSDEPAPPTTTTTAAPANATTSTAPTSQSATGTTSSAEPSAASILLDSLEVKGRAPSNTYDRDLFGQAWSDDVRVEGGRNGCDTRNDILRRDLSDEQIRPGTEGCLVESGLLEEPYSGEIIDFERGDSQVHIDHVVALADAWAKGAQAWDEDRLRDFANDPRNLLAVDAGLNMQKGAGDAATWQPPNREFRCDYARMIIVVKGAYDLWVTPAEYDALARELTRCD